jgi:hypothetical protein
MGVRPFIAHRLLLITVLPLICRADRVLFVCSPGNDVFTRLESTTGGALNVQRFETVDQALLASCNDTVGGSLYVLSEGYPATTTALSAAQWQAVQACGLRLFLEYPTFAPELGIGGSQPTAPGPVKRSYFARLVVNSTALEAHGLPPMRVLMAQDAYVSFVVDGTSAGGACALLCTLVHHGRRIPHYKNASITAIP